MTGKKVKRFPGAPFGTQKARFDISAVHPQSKMPGTYTEVPYCRKATSKENRRLGPGTYSIETGSFTDKAVRIKSAGPNWRKAFDSAKLSAIPHMLYREQWNQKRLLIQQLGPGRYKNKDFVEEINSRPSSNRGICQTKASRFQQENKFQANLPGPGTYGKGGVPWATMEEKSKSSSCTVGVMEGGTGRSYNLKNEGSGLAPGVYKQTSPLQQLLNKSVSKRGPYDLYTGERIPSDKAAALHNNHLAPGRYDIKPFTDEINDRDHKRYGEFSTLPQYPMPPTDRIYCSTLSQWPRMKEDPGPGYYKYIMIRSQLSSAPGRYAFNSSAGRFNKMSKRNINHVGAGQYNINRWEEYQHRNGNKSVFQSATPRLPPDVDSPHERLLNERVHPKHLAEQHRLFLLPVEAPC